uniref:Uncharacterized protein n=1 Tax=Anguilla anguilla TaxID=7936 RepID=A0A0E9VNK4_ANGAN
MYKSVKGTFRWNDIDTSINEIWRAFFQQYIRLFRQYNLHKLKTRYS